MKSIAATFDTEETIVETVGDSTEAYEIQMVMMDLIKPSPFVIIEAREVQISELAESIRLYGLQTPIKLRALDDGRYEIVFGHRRWMAFKKLGSKSIPATVESLSDYATRILQMTENAQRLDDDVWITADVLKKMNDEGATIQQIAEDIGKPRQWVGRRVRIAGIGEKIRKHIPKGLSTAHLEILAEFPDDVIKEIVRLDLSECSVSRLRKYVEQHMKRTLHNAIFDVKDAKLDPGACTACPFRQNAQADLFAAKTNDIDKGDRCLRPECYQNKCDQHITIVRASYEEANGRKLTVISNDYKYLERNKDAIRDYGLQPAQESDADAFPAIYVDGKFAGKIKFVKDCATQSFDAPAKGNAKPEKPESGRALLDEKEKRLAERRSGAAVTIWRGMLDEIEIPANAFELLLAFGSNHNLSSLYDVGGDDPWKKIKMLQTLGDMETMNALAWNRVKETLRSRLNFYNLGTIDRFLDEAKRQVAVLNQDFRKIKAEAEKQLPESATLIKLRAEVEGKSRSGKALKASATNTKIMKGKKKR